MRVASSPQPMTSATGNVRPASKVVPVLTTLPTVLVRIDRLQTDSWVGNTSRRPTRPCQSTFPSSRSKLSLRVRLAPTSLWIMQCASLPSSSTTTRHKLTCSSRVRAARLSWRECPVESLICERHLPCTTVRITRWLLKTNCLRAPTAPATQR